MSFSQDAAGFIGSKRVCDGDDKKASRDQPASSLSPTSTNYYSAITASWRIWKVIDHLKATTNDAPKDYDVALLNQVIEILQLWADTWGSTTVGNNNKVGSDKWKSFLNKRSLLHEVEESLIALHHINKWRKNYMQTSTAFSGNSGNISNRFVAADICGGKGVFTMLLQYLASLHWSRADKQEGALLDRIILLEKATSDEIDWYHLKAEPAIPRTDLVPIDIWDGCNLHETDELVDRFQSFHHPVALTGIHLCKLLSPSLISLVNLLGPNKCPYLCLAPCCMPRAVTKTARHKQHKRQDKQGESITAQSSFVRVYSHESVGERKARLDRRQRRVLATRRLSRKTFECFCCRSTDHLLKFCPKTKDISKEDLHRLEQQAAEAHHQSTPCWNCGFRGHFKANCPNRSIRSGQTTVVEGAQVDPTSLLEPPVTVVDVTNVLESAYPMRTYCELLANSLDSKPQSNDEESQQLSWTRRIWETNLVNSKAEKQTENN